MFSASSECTIRHRKSDEDRESTKALSIREGIFLLEEVGGTSGRAIPFCLGRPSLNPSIDLGFLQFRMAVNLFLQGVELFLIMCNRMVHPLPASFLFPITIYYCKMDQL